MSQQTKTQNESNSPKKLPFTIDEINVMDTIFLSEDDDTPYLVLDTGKPFILIENKLTNFATLYRPTINMYKYV